jgi:hypothetical protein
MTDTPENPSHADAPPAAAAPPTPSPARVLRLPSTRASAVLAAAMLAIGVAVGAAIGPAPQPSLASQSLPALIASLAAKARSEASRQASAAAVQPPPVSAQETPTATTPSAPTSSNNSSPNSSSGASSSPSKTSPGTSAPAPTGATGAKGATLPPVTSVWLIQLNGNSFTEALAQPAAAPYIDSQLIPAGTFLSGWSALTGSAFASSAALSERQADLGATPPLLYSFVQPPCPEGAAGAACAPGTPGQLTAADEFLKATISQITTTATFREHGLVVVTFATVALSTAAGLPAGASTATLTSQPPGGVVLVSPFVRAGARSSTTFNSSSPTRSLEKLLHQ